MNTLAENRSKVQRALELWTSSKATFWSYTVSHCELAIRLTRPGIRGNLHLTCAACKSISCPVRWNDSRIEIAWGDLGEDITVRDHAAGVTIVCKAVEIDEDVEPVY